MVAMRAVSYLDDVSCIDLMGVDRGRWVPARVLDHTRKYASWLQFGDTWSKP